MLKNPTIKSALFIPALAGLMLFSCNKEDDAEPIINKTGPYHDGVFVTNEGSYLGNNGSISYYSYSENITYNIVADTVYNDIFNNVNGRALGDVVQSITLYDSLAFIVVNNSNKVEVVTSENFKEYNVINGVSQPRYILVNDSIAYISAWGNGGVVYVVDLGTFTVRSIIKVGNGPEKMLIDGDKLYVANSGGLSSDSTVTIISTVTNQKIDSMIVGGNPKAIVKDKNGNKWILCNGIVEYNPIDYSITRETQSQLIELNGNDEIIKTVLIAETEHPSFIDINPSGEIIYIGGGYSYSGIKSFSISSNSFAEFTDDQAYGFIVGPKNGELFVFVSTSFTDNGLLKRYTSDGTFIKSYTVGIGPNGGASSKRATTK